jgi:hypothetical protein
MDELIKRSLMTIGIILGGLAFIYLMMNFAGIRPVGIAADLFLMIETILKTVVFIIGIGAGLVVLGVIACAIYNAITERKKRLAQEQRRIEEEAANEKRRLREEKLAREIELKKAKEAHLRKLELARRQKEKLEYLKSRSASDATKDALEDFL